MDKQNKDNRTDFEKELEVLINKHNVEKDSNTPDFLIATYLMGCLQNWNISVKNREEWFRATPKELSDSLMEQTE
jgi:hypothetical protein